MKRKSYLFLFKKEHYLSTNAAVRKIKKMGLLVLAQYGNIAIEVSCSPNKAEKIFALNLFHNATASSISKETLKLLSKSQKKIVGIWNARFNPKYVKRKKTNAKVDNYEWNGKETKEPAPYLPFDIQDFEKRLKKRIKKEKINLKGLKPAIKIDTNNYKPAHYKKLKDFYTKNFDNEIYAHHISGMYYHLRPPIRDLIISTDLQYILFHIIDEIVAEEGCWKMHGQNSVGLVFVESSRANGPTFTNTQRNEITTELMAGLSWLTQQHPSGNLSWVYDTQHINIDVANRAEGDGSVNSSYDVYWRDPAMGEVDFEGHTYTADLAGIRAYREDMRTHHGSEHATVYFITPYGSSWHAYSSGRDFNVFAEHGNNWGGRGVSGLDRVSAHEMCHKFGATDEYTGSGTPCSSCGGAHGCDNIPNGNCGACSNTGEDCLMEGSCREMCQYTRAQIGWSDIFVELFTADEYAAGTNDDVILDIGTRTFNLDIDGYNDRESGNREGHALWTGGNLELDEIKRILIKKEADGFYGGWKLSRIKVYHNGNVICDNNTDVNIEDDDLLHLACEFDNTFVNTLRVAVTTADSGWAGTNDTVRFVVGDKEWVLNNDGNDFERGDTNTFNLYPGINFRLTDLTRFTIRKSSDGVAGGWRLGGVRIIANGTTIYNNQRINRWIEDSTLSFTDDI